MDVLSAAYLSGDDNAADELLVALACETTSLACTLIKPEWLNTAALWSSSKVRDLIFECVWVYNHEPPSDCGAFVRECIAQGDARFQSILTPELLLDETLATTIYDYLLNHVPTLDFLRVIDDVDVSDASVSFARPYVPQLINRAVVDHDIDVVIDVWHAFLPVSGVTAQSAVGVLCAALREPRSQRKALEIVQTRAKEEQMELLPALATLAAQGPSRKLRQHRTPLVEPTGLTAQRLVSGFLRIHNEFHSEATSKAVARAVVTAPWHNYVCDMPDLVCEHLLTYMSTAARNAPCHNRGRRSCIVRKLSRMLASCAPGSDKFYLLLDAFLRSKPLEADCMFLQHRMPSAEFDDMMKQFATLVPELAECAQALLHVAPWYSDLPQLLMFKSKVAKLACVPQSFEGVLADEVFRAYDLLYDRYNTTKVVQMSLACESLMGMLTKAALEKCTDGAQVTRVFCRLDSHVILTHVPHALLYEKGQMTPHLVDLLYCDGASKADYATTAYLLPIVFQIPTAQAPWKALSMISNWNVLQLAPFAEQICQANAMDALPVIFNTTWLAHHCNVMSHCTYADLRKSLLTLNEADALTAEQRNSVLDALLAHKRPVDIETVLRLARHAGKRNYKSWLLAMQEHAPDETVLGQLAEIMVEYNTEPIQYGHGARDFLTQGFLHGFVLLYPKFACRVMLDIGSLLCLENASTGERWLKMDDDALAALDALLDIDRIDRNVLRVARRHEFAEVMEHFATEYSFDCMWDLMASKGRVQGMVKRIVAKPDEFVKALARFQQPLDDKMQRCYQMLCNKVCASLVPVPRRVVDKHVRVALELAHDMQKFAAEPFNSSLAKLDALTMKELSMFTHLGHVSHAAKLYAFRVRHPAVAVLLLGETMIERVCETRDKIAKYSRAGGADLGIVFAELDARVTWHPSNVNPKTARLWSSDSDDDNDDENVRSLPNSPCRQRKKPRVCK